MKADWDPVAHYQDIAVAENYDRERFSSLAGRVFNRVEQYCIARAFMGLPENTLVLDLPCGTGRLAETLLRKGYRVHGIDISPAMLHVAAERLSSYGNRFQVTAQDIFTLPDDASPQYDAALCARVLIHFDLPQQIRFLRNVARLTRRHVIFTHSLSTPYQRTRRHLKGLLRQQPSEGHPVTEQQLRELMAASGLREIRRLRPARLMTHAIIVVAEKL
jgi:2-polyprenyl-3-methyl-5-hydroxy-6-metoxy-1,4-benzoquinol methylase